MIKKLFILLCLCCIGIGNVWGEEKSYTEIFTIKSADVVNNSGYKAYIKGVDSQLYNTAWVITFGGNNKSVGTNSGSRSNCKLSSYENYAVSPVTTSDVASAFVSTTLISDIAKISYTFSGGSNQTSTNVYLIYSSDGKTFSQISLTSGTQGAAISSGTEYEFTKCSGYFGLLFKATNTSGNWRIDDVNITFYKAAGPTKLETPTNLQATNVASTSATLTWDAVEHASSYEVNVIGGDSYDETFTPATNSLLVEGLTASTEYLWSVKAIGDGVTYSDSEESEGGEFTTLAPPTTTYTVTFNGNEHGTPASASITEAEAGAGVTLPNCTPNTGYQFVGWATTSTATEADAGVAGATYYPTSNVTLHAVYNQVFTITWNVNGTPTTEGNPTTSVVEGEGITILPTTLASISGMAFRGWTATQIATSSATAPTDLFTDAEHAPAITGNTIFYAVFAQENESTETLVIEDYATTNSWTSSLAYTSASTANVTFTGAGTGNNCKYYSSDQSWRFYSSGDGKITITAPGNITKVELSGTSYFTVPTGWSLSNKVFTPQAQTQTKTVTISNGSGTSQITKIAVTYSSVGNYYTSVVVKELTGIEVTGTPTEFWRGGTFNHDGITVTAHYDDESTKDVTSSATFTGYDMNTAGEQTVTVSYETASTTYDITVKAIANTAATAYTVAEAIALIDANPTELSTTDVYVKGTVSEIVTPWNDSFKNITYNIFDDGETTSSQFQLYRCVTNGAVAGDYVIGYGKIKKYVKSGNPDVYEFDAGNSIVNTANMTITSAKWGTFCTPFDVTIPDGVNAYTATETNGEVTFNEVTTTIPAGTPVVVYSDTEVDKNYFGALAEEETCTSGALVGVYTATSGIPATENGNQNYVLQNNTQGVGFYKANNNISLKANRCYMTLPSTSGAKESFLFDEVVTGINTILNNKDKSVEGIFDLNGRRLPAPRKGVNIINGVKVIVK